MLFELADQILGILLASLIIAMSHQIDQDNRFQKKLIFGIQVKFDT